MFRRISEEVGSTDSGEIRYRKLYGSSLSSFLSDVQIYELIRKFKLKQKEGGGGKQYFRGRTISEDDFVVTPLNAALFSWVIENLCKNAIDAMGNDGTISIDLREKENQIYIDITDTGKGVPKSQFKTIFQPGYSTKRRGWGLGLSLAKRIIENYHNGKIFIKWSELGKGTTFRIILGK